MAVEIFSDSDIRTIVEIAYMKLMKEKDEYSGRGSGFTLESIDGLLLAVPIQIYSDGRIVVYRVTGVYRQEAGDYQPTERRPVLFQVGDSGKARDEDNGMSYWRKL